MSKNSDQKPVPLYAKWFGYFVGTCFVVVLGGMFTVVILSILTGIREANKVETPEEAAKKKQNELNEWFDRYSQYSCEDNVKEKLREPNSYERDGEFLVTDNTGTKKAVSWKFRAKNGFGGYNISAAICSVSKENSGTTKVVIIDSN